MDYFITAIVIADSYQSKPVLALKYIEFDYHCGRSTPDYLALESEYFTIYKDYGADYEKMFRLDRNTYLLSTNMPVDEINKGIPLVKALPSIYKTIIEDHITPSRIQHWVHRAFKARCRTMRDFNRYLLAYLYDQQYKEVV